LYIKHVKNYIYLYKKYTLIICIKIFII